MEVYIYSLVDPRTNEIRYIGKTNNLYDRFYSHYGFDLRSKNYDKIKWIKELRDSDLVPEMKVIETVSDENWAEREKYWIKYYREIGCNLLNKTDGGDCGPVKSGEENGFAKLKKEDVTSIRREYIETKIKVSDLARKYGVAISTIRGIISNKRYYDPNYHPKLRQNHNRNKLTEKEIRKIIQYRENGKTIRELADEFRRTTETIRKVIGNL